MNLNNELIFTIAFELTLFFVFVYYLLLIIKKYLIPPLKQGIVETQKKWNYLISKKGTFQEKREKIEQEVTIQQKKLISFEEKMQEWHTALHHAQDLCKDKQKQLQESIHAKRKKQSNTLTFLTMQRRIIPQALEKARKQLIKKFVGKQGKESLSKIISYLQKENKAS